MFEQLEAFSRIQKLWCRTLWLTPFVWCIRLFMTLIPKSLSSKQRPLVELGMRDAMGGENHQVSWQEVILAWLGHMELYEPELQPSALDIVRLSCSSKSMRALLAAHMASGDRLAARSILQHTVEECKVASADTSTTALKTPWQQTYIRAVQYLLQISDIPSELMLGDSPKLLKPEVYNVPMALKETLIAAGARVTYEQFQIVATATYTEEPSLELSKKVYETCQWISAQCSICRQQGQPTRFSELVEAVCAGQEVSEELQQDLNWQTARELIFVALYLNKWGQSDVCFKSLTKGPAGDFVNAVAARDLMSKGLCLCCSKRIPGYLAARRTVEDIAHCVMKDVSDSFCSMCFANLTWL